MNKFCIFAMVCVAATLPAVLSQEKKQLRENSLYLYDKLLYDSLKNNLFDFALTKDIKVDKDEASLRGKKFNLFKKIAKKIGETIENMFHVDLNIDVDAN